MNIKSFINIFCKKTTINIVYSDFSFLKKNIKIKQLPIVGDKIYFDEIEIYEVTDIIHYYKDRRQVIWIIVEKGNKNISQQIK